MDNTVQDDSPTSIGRWIDGAGVCPLQVDLAHGIEVVESPSGMPGDQHSHRPGGVRFHTRGKAVTTRWPGDAAAPTGLRTPTRG